MCGIFGILDPARPLGTSAQAWAEQAQLRLQHRGPDGRQRVTLMDGRCLLGHLRLAIIDIEGGAQPISNEDGTIWVVCNGEIYNYLELREKLEAQGHRFSTNSDTEVLVHLFEEKGTSLLDDLEGMYAFAIVDTRKEQLFLARDRFGEKPLYWAPIRDGKALAFASELKALLPLDGVDHSLDVAGVAQFLALGYLPAPRTHLNGVSKLRAGEAIVFGPGSDKRTFRYWRPEFANSNGHRPFSQTEAIELVRNRFREAVRVRLRSHVPVGAFLSGGVDSTLVVSTIRELLPHASLTTFCASFDDEELNEAPYARRIAERIGSDHHEVHFSSTELLSVFDDLIDHYDEPFADASMFPTFAVCRAARQHCKVMMSGDGGDECFGGYRPFFWHSRWHPLRRLRGVNDAADLLLRGWNPRWRGTGLLTFLHKNDWQLLYPEQERASTLACFQPEHQEPASSGLQELKDAAIEHARLSYPLSAMEDMANGYLPEQILVKVDRASMLSAVECRTPFLDRDLFAFAASLPIGYQFAHGQGKALLRRCLPDWVPPEVRWRKKQGFTPPLDTWFRTTLGRRMEEAIADVSRRLSHVIVPSRVAHLYQEHLAGADRSALLFRWLVLSRSLTQARSACA
ncbi:MAG TPA: asparagine synthase (glutamine-hydrolyzing) [Terriglobales bacterium]|nr:asparagine synthase (glutamine-hydrolyzing) [Terriglobales bacterium]